ncbi:MAG: hypothetical protein KGQ37_04325 [Hyphomicrobiales bacterium]|nr:hypothetical protein [Hyphomicrobiales bacterium]
MRAVGYVWLCTLAVLPMAHDLARAATLPPGEVALTAAEIKAEAIDTTTMQLQAFAPTRPAFARVLSSAPLIALRERLAKARADALAAHARSTALAARYNRDLSLFNTHHAASAQTMQDSKAASAAADSAVVAATARIEMIKASLVQHYGAQLADDPATLQALQGGKARLVSVVLPPAYAGAPPAMLDLATPDGSMAPAHLAGPASAVDPAASGRPFLYVTTAPLPQGLATTARLPLGAPHPALLVPASAQLWYAGERWAYVALPHGLFQRRKLTGHAIDGQFPVGAPFRPGDKIVTSGAQLLLSQELLPHAIATACKDPPECDD